MKAFIQTIANMTQDGEEIDGKEFVMENDDAIATLNDLIDQARALIEKHKPKTKDFAYPDPVADPMRDSWWLYTDRNGKTFGSTMFISGKDRTADLRRREKLRIRWGSEEREKKARDWLPHYIKALPKSIELQTRINTNFPEPYPESDDKGLWETFKKRREDYDTDTEMYKRQMATHKRKIFGGK